MAKPVKVIEGYPGVGKAAWAIENINSSTDKKILYITPFLDEIKRIKKDCEENQLFDPEDKYEQGGKSRHFVELVQEGKNIITTHELSKEFDPTVLINLFSNKGYTLYIDEAQQVITKYNPTNLERVYPDTVTEKYKSHQRDLITVLDTEIIEIKGDGTVKWLNPKFKLTPLLRFKRECEHGRIKLLGDYFSIWLFPEEFFKTDLFDEIYY